MNDILGTGFLIIFAALHCSAQFCNAITIVILLPDCKPEGPLFSVEFVCESVCLSVCLCVSDRHFYPSALTDFAESWSQGPYSDLVLPRP